MDQRSDLLQLLLEWLGTRRLLGVLLAASTTVLRWLLDFDGTARELALSFGTVAVGRHRVLYRRERIPAKPRSSDASSGCSAPSVELANGIRR